ncbi:MAG: diacylglycerol kinase family protein, partial [Draconibacterium sp.]|nr:diacylglycerol kinase family protein [Draconibacterium sp.]
MRETSQKKWTVILNPHAGGGKGKRDWKRIERHLKKEGFQFESLISEYPKHAISLAKKAVENGSTDIIVAGGDGTLNEVANGIFHQTFCFPEKITVGMIPVGTGNDWIKTFGIPNNYQQAIQKIKEEKTLLQDIGKLTYEEDGVKSTRYFSNMAGFGFDAQVAHRANLLKEKGRSGILVYLQSLMSAF